MLIIYVHQLFVCLGVKYNNFNHVRIIEWFNFSDNTYAYVLNVIEDAIRFVEIF